MLREIWFLILLSTSVTSLKSQSAGEILGQYFDTVSNGNFDNWKSIKAAYIESTSWYSSKEFQGSPDFGLKELTVHKSYRVWPDKSRSDLYNDSSLVSSFFHVGKDHFFVMGNMAPMPISSGPYEPYFEFDPVIIRNAVDKAKGVDMLGVAELQGLKCYEIRVDTKELIWHLYFNVDTFLLEFWANSPDGDKSILTKVYDYQRFGDYFIPMSELKTRNGSIFFSSRRNKIELNVDIDPEIFVYKSK